MRNHSSPNRHRQIRARLATADVADPGRGARLLARAVWKIVGTRAEHTQCRAALPALVDAEIGGAFAVFERARREHLLVCERCAALYADLLEITLLDLRDQLPAPRPRVNPDLSFLEARDD